jgi:hypothetical protein
VLSDCSASITLLAEAWYQICTCQLPRAKGFGVLVLKGNPHFWFGLDEGYCEIRPHICLYDATQHRLVPDFMARVEDSSIWDVIELKRPQHPLTVNNRGTERPSASASRAIAELLQYRDFFGSRENRKRVVNRFGTAPYEPSLVLVIGRGRPRERYEWRSARVGLPRVQVVSYDYLFERAQECSAYLSERRVAALKREENANADVPGVSLE